MVEKGEIEVFILAGGKSKRMGTDKGLVNFKGIPMILHILRILDKLSLKTSIISNNQEYLKFGKPLFQDLIPNKGPLGGLFTALHYSQSPSVLLLACDMPSINEEGIKSLMELSEPGKITVATDVKQISPLFACYPVSLIDEVKESILADELKMQDFVSKQSYNLLDLNALCNTDVLMNLNTQEELKDAEKNKSEKGI